MLKSHDPAARPPVPAVCLQSTYFQSIRSPSAAPAAYSPIQSFGVGLPIPLQLTVTPPPGPTLLGLALRLADPLAVRVAVAVLAPVLVGWGVLAPRVVEPGVAVLVAEAALVVEVAPRVGVFVAARAGVFVD